MVNAMEPDDPVTGTSRGNLRSHFVRNAASESSERNSDATGSLDLKPDDAGPAAGGSGDRIVDRRAFLGTAACGLLAAPLAAEAQQPVRDALDRALAMQGTRKERQQAARHWQFAAAVRTCRKAGYRVVMRSHGRRAQARVPRVSELRDSKGRA